MQKSTDMETYYIGNAFDCSKNRKVWVLMFATNKDSAYKKYFEHLTRHPELAALDNPQICIFIGNPEEHFSLIDANNLTIEELVSCGSCTF